MRSEIVGSLGVSERWACRGRYIKSSLKALEAEMVRRGPSYVILGVSLKLEQVEPQTQQIIPSNLP